MRQALRPNPKGQQVSQSIGLPPPVGGWNARDALTMMDATDAVILTNWIPRSGYVELRRGYAPWVTGFGAQVDRLIPYRGGAGADKLFAASANALYDVSVGGGLVAPVMSGFHSDQWQYTAFAATSVEWTIAVNGADPPIGYHQGAWANLPALSGSSGPINLDPTALFSVFAHSSRLYYLEKNSLRVWSPAPAAIGGVCTLLDLGSVFNKGGRLVCGASWSAVLGLQADEFAVFMTDQGQVAVYAGFDPTDINNWTLMGIYDLGQPLGPRAMLKYGGDLAVVTTDGIIPLSKAITMDRTQQDVVALSDKIMMAFKAATKAYGGKMGWQGLLYPGAGPTTVSTAVGGSLAIFNVPVNLPAEAWQFVLNPLTGAWCKFTGVNALCWELMNDAIFFGAADGVYQWDLGASDNGKTIVADVLGVYSSHGQPARQKHYKAIRPALYAPSLVKPALDICVDFVDTQPLAVPVVLDRGSAAPVMRFDWTGATGFGTVGAPRMQVNVQGDPTAPLLLIDQSPAVPFLVTQDHGAGGQDLLLIQPSLPFDVPCQIQGFSLLYEPGGVIG